MKKMHQALVAGTVALSPMLAMATSELDSTAASIVTSVGGAITAGLTVFAAIAGIRYVIRAFRAASKG